MRIIEDELKIRSDGSLTLSADYLQEMGVLPESTVRIAFLADGSGQNTYREFLLGGLGPNEDEHASIQIPTELLQKAGFSYDDDLNIVCLDGCILICCDTLLNEQELSAVMESMDITADCISSLSDDPQRALQQIEDAIAY